MKTNDPKDEILKRASQQEKPQAEEKKENVTQQPPTDSDDDFANIGDFRPGSVVNRNIVDEMKSSYLDYSMSVIVARALPDIRDGLKPSQRRILVAMNDQHLYPNAQYRKSAKIAGATSGDYHPHGEQVVYPTMVKMAQEFATRYPLVDGQGNFGSIDGDKPAAMRYTEARMSKITLYMLKDLDKGTVEFTPNYDGRLLEPTVLPTVFPNLLCNGSDGIAVGMATKIPPHNLREVVEALHEMIKRGNKWTGKSLYNELRKEREKSFRIPQPLNSTPENILERYTVSSPLEYEKKIKELEDRLEKENATLYPEFHSDITPEELIKIIPGPDFPTGGIIYNQKDILNAYATGRGRVLIRAKASIQEGKRGRFEIIVTEIPYQVNKSHMLQKIADLAKDKKITGIADIRDESNREGIRVVIVLKKDAQPKSVLNKLYKYTEMQKVFNANMIALVNNQPQLLSLKQMLEHFISFRIQVTIRRFEYDLAQDKYRDHILEGLLKALDILDEVIATIRGSKTQEIAKENLIKKFDFTEVQAQAILDMPLKRLAALEREKLQNEHDEIQKNIKYYEKVLTNEEEILAVIDKDLQELAEKQGDDRRTKVVKQGVTEISELDLVPEEETFVSISKEGYIKRMKPDVYRTQKRGGKGIVGAVTKEGDYIKHALICNTHDELLLFTNKGRVFVTNVYEIPEFSRNAKGLPIINLVQITQGELITSVLTRNKQKGIQTEADTEKNNKPEQQYKYLFMATKNGTVKKTALSDFEKIRSTGLIAIKLDEGDELEWVKPTTGNDDILLITKMGRSIRFAEEDVRPTGRSTRGVRGIKFKFENDEVVSMDTISGEDFYVFTVSEKGYGKMTNIKEYPKQNRGGSGVYTFRVKDKTGQLVSARAVTKPEEREVFVMSEKGIVIRSKMDHIPSLGRQTSGVRIMKLNDNDRVSAIAII